MNILGSHNMMVDYTFYQRTLYPRSAYFHGCWGMRVDATSISLAFTVICVPSTIIDDGNSVVPSDYDVLHTKAHAHAILTLVCIFVVICFVLFIFIVIGFLVLIITEVIVLSIRFYNVVVIDYVFFQLLRRQSE